MQFVIQRSIVQVANELHATVRASDPSAGVLSVLEKTAPIMVQTGGTFTHTDPAIQFELPASSVRLTMPLQIHRVFPLDDTTTLGQTETEQAKLWTETIDTRIRQALQAAKDSVLAELPINVSTTVNI
jgi:hypothetical protein